MSLVTLVSGGLDSTLMAVLAKEEGIQQFPLFINYGQLCKSQEWQVCERNFKKLKLPKPVVMNMPGFGKNILSGLTNRKLRINEDAFLPGRNLLFLVMAGSYAYQNNCKSISIGFLSEGSRLFPDQGLAFLEKSMDVINEALGTKGQLKIIAPLINFTKKDVISIAAKKGIMNTYSCHKGLKKACGVCVSCLEIKNAMT